MTPTRALPLLALAALLAASGNAAADPTIRLLDDAVVIDVEPADERVEATTGAPLPDQTFFVDCFAAPAGTVGHYCTISPGVTYGGHCTTLTSCTFGRVVADEYNGYSRVGFCADPVEDEGCQALLVSVACVGWQLHASTLLPEEIACVETAGDRVCLVEYSSFPPGAPYARREIQCADVTIPELQGDCVVYDPADASRHEACVEEDPAGTCASASTTLNAGERAVCLTQVGEETCLVVKTPTPIRVACFDG